MTWHMSYYFHIMFIDFPYYVHICFVYGSYKFHVFVHIWCHISFHIFSISLPYIPICTTSIISLLQHNSNTNNMPTLKSNMPTYKSTMSTYKSNMPTYKSNMSTDKSNMPTYENI